MGIQEGIKPVEFTPVDVNALSTFMANDQWEQETKSVPKEELYETGEDGKEVVSMGYAHKFFGLKALWTDLIMQFSKD